MSEYKAPLRDMRFALNDVLQLEQHYAELGAEDLTQETVDAILGESAKFVENKVAPLRQIGDQQGCKLEDGRVTTPDGFKEVYAQFIEAGWQALSMPEEFGGQGMPSSLASVLTEMRTATNMPWEGHLIANHGAMKTLITHGTEQQKNCYLRKLVSGEWSGTMCLTEAHCGTDLGLLRTAATPQSDGTYRITGTKIFITMGDHDYADNIVHIVLARIDGAPKGTKGISLFIIPKVTCDEAGNLGEPNTLSCGSLEHKMGMHASPTCVMHFDGATGYLLGQPNKGLMAMFTFMNAARISTSLQALGQTEFGFQKSAAYARERLQMRSLSGPRKPDGEADPIIVHPDVRRMLLTQKAFAEGLRMLIYYLAFQLDNTAHENESVRSEAQATLDLLTPIAKAFGSEVGLESASHAVQCFGGHGFIWENGVEQNYRDLRISSIYEGTTGVQANDLLGRKVLSSHRERLEQLIDEMINFSKQSNNNSSVAALLPRLGEAASAWREVTERVVAKVAQDPEEMGAAGVPYLMISGYVCLAYFWAKAAVVAAEQLANGAEDDGFLQAKIQVACFYYDHLLIRTHSLATTIDAGATNLMALDAEHFTF